VDVRVAVVAVGAAGHTHGLEAVPVAVLGEVTLLVRDVAPAKLSAAARRHIWLGSATVALAGTATGLLLASDAMNQRYNDPETPYGELAGLDEGVRRTSTAAIITGSVGVVTGAALVITW
jgi:hypothetical protein